MDENRVLRETLRKLKDDRGLNQAGVGRILGIKQQNAGRLLSTLPHVGMGRATANNLSARDAGGARASVRGRPPVTPRQRLDNAIAHFEAAADDDPGRIGLAFVEVLHARNELLAEEGEAARSFHAADKIGGGDLEGAVARTRARLLEDVHS